MSRLKAFATHPTTLWGLLSLTAALLAIDWLAVNDPLQLGGRTIAVLNYPIGHDNLYRLTVFGFALPVFFLINSAFDKAWHDFDFAAVDGGKNNRLYKYKDVNRNVESTNLVFQRFRFSAFWYVTASHVVLASIIIVLGSGIVLYATLALAPPTATADPSTLRMNDSVGWLVLATRIGFVLLIVFLAQILVPVYHYLLQMHAAATARADAMLMLRPYVDQTDKDAKAMSDAVARVTEVLTLENVPFGKPPRTPAKDIAEILKAIDAGKKQASGH